MINTEGLDRIDVIVALYNASKAQGMGHFQESFGRGFTVENARERFDQGQSYFDYVEGRIIKVDLSNEKEFGPRLYDRDNGEGAAQCAIDALRTRVTA